jgi:hypothetical protein
MNFLANTLLFLLLTFIHSTQASQCDTNQMGTSASSMSSATLSNVKEFITSETSSHQVSADLDVDQFTHSAASQESILI